jgi:ubiquinone/menaquinone biosynthesis C-methylase UbiE
LRLSPFWRNSHIVGLRTELCYYLSRLRLAQPAPAEAVVDIDYHRWRLKSLSKSWLRFDDGLVRGKHVLDFGCGAGQLSLFLSATREPASITGIDVDLEALSRAKAALAQAKPDDVTNCRFIDGHVDGLPFGDGAIETILAFDCLEHVMRPESIMAEFARVLAPGGTVVIEWFPFRGPWGPHMDSLIPLPWAHVLFGERAMFAAAARIYDHPQFKARYWDRDETGNKRPNKWRQWSSFRQQGYVNQLTMPQFKRLVQASGFEFFRCDLFGIGGAQGPIAKLGRAVTKVPFVGEWLTSYALIELRKG